MDHFQVLYLNSEELTTQHVSVQGVIHRKNGELQVHIICSLTVFYFPSFAKFVKMYKKY